MQGGVYLLGLFHPFRTIRPDECSSQEPEYRQLKLLTQAACGFADLPMMDIQCVKVFVFGHANGIQMAGDWFGQIHGTRRRRLFNSTLRDALIEGYIGTFFSLYEGSYPFSVIVLHRNTLRFQRGDSLRSQKWANSRLDLFQNRNFGRK